MKTIELKLYKFSELSPESQDKALSRLYDINVSHEWYDYLQEEARSIGLNITSFDTDRHQIEASLTMSADDSAYLILKSHGAECATYALAKQFLADFERLPSDEYGERDEDAFAALSEDFEHSLAEEYLSLLRKEVEYLMSAESITETITANDYDFTENGEIY
jgi:hypothetical protein